MSANLNANLDANLVRVAWSVVENTSVLPEPNLSLADKIGAVVREIENRVTLSPQERQLIRQYILERQHLITDLYQ